MLKILLCLSAVALTAVIVCCALGYLDFWVMKVFG